MAGTLKICRSYGIVTQDPKEVINKLYDENSRESGMIIYHSNLKTLSSMVNEILLEIKSRNEKIKDINKQMLPYVYFWNDIDGCLAVTCCEINMGPFETTADGLFCFGTKVHYDCLTDPNARKTLTPKYFNLVSTLGFLHGGK